MLILISLFTSIRFIVGKSKKFRGLRMSSIQKFEFKFNFKIFFGLSVSSFRVDSLGISGKKSYIFKKNLITDDPL